jgi:FAD/FMN-containing dehydrogenase
VPGVSTARVDSALDGLAGEPHWKLRYKGSARDIFFSTPLDQAPRFLATMLTAAGSHKYPAADVGVYLQPQHQGVTYHCEFSLPFDPADKASTAQLRELYTDASTRLIQGGAYFSRPYGEWARPVYNRDGQSTSALRAVKKILDPNNVLNPGKLCF